MRLPSCLIVERGYPFEGGAIIPLRHADLILGRKVESWEPDVAFDNVFVSRKQASVYFDNGVYFIMDMGSKHGTAVNGCRLAPFAPRPLGPADSISFAKGSVVLSFSPVNLEETLDSIPAAPESGRPADGYSLDPVRQTVRLRDRDYRFTDKEFRCVELLLGKERQFVPRDELIRHVWPERSGEDGGDSAAPEEINSLLYRIRKKTGRAFSIENIRGKGYILHALPPEERKAAGKGVSAP
ncbi:FHA domain-containing protein [Paenibacillus flagellatus]|nr:FHA domain-containing protein [Paenibacillus flagellatus]